MVKLPDKDPLISHTIKLRSRYSETDKMGYVYYGHYLQYFEVARTELIRNAGISYRQMEDAGIMLPVVNAEISYKNPVNYDELMEITVHIYDYPMVRLTTYYEVVTGIDNQLNTLGKVDLVFMNAKSRRPIKAPSVFNETLRDFITATHE